MFFNIPPAGARACHTRFTLHVNSTAHPDSLGTLVFPTDDALGRMVSIRRHGHLVWTATDGATGPVAIAAMAGVNRSQRNKLLGVSRVQPGVHQFEVLYRNE